MSDCMEDFISEIVGRIEIKFAKSNPKGRPKAEMYVVIKGILYRRDNGCPWRALPAEYGPWKTVYHWYRLLSQSGLFLELWKDFLAKADSLGLVNHSAYIMDGSIVKAPNGGTGTGPNPTGRGRLGAKRSIITDANGEPIGSHSTKANRHDSKVFLNTIRKALIPLRAGSYMKMDKAYNGGDIREYCIKHGLVPVIPKKKGEKIGETGAELKGRQVVEWCFSWINKKRGLAIRYERRADYYDSMLEFWCAYRWFKRVFNKNPTQ
jgi:putative transposase